VADPTSAYPVPLREAGSEQSRTQHLGLETALLTIWMSTMSLVSLTTIVSTKDPRAERHLMPIDLTTYPIDLSCDPFLEAQVERALAPYRPMLTPELAEVFRDELILALVEHPEGSALLRSVRPVAMVTESGTQEIEYGSEAGPVESETKVRAGGGQ